MAVLYVDDDGSHFTRDDVYTSIQDAVNDSRRGDTIKVAPGLYEESVTVDKKLTITGFFAPSNRAGDYDPASDPDRASIVDPLGPATVGFNLVANDIVVQGFTVGNFDDDADSVGILTGNSTTGNKIRNNVIQDNSIGIYLNSSTASNNNGSSKSTQVIGNTIRDNNAEGAAAGSGIYSDQGLRNAKISGNRFFGHQNVAINLTGGTVQNPLIQSKITISGNVLQDDSTIRLVNTRDSSVIGNVSDGALFNGIELAGGNSKVTIKGNVLRDGGDGTEETGGGYTGINLVPDFFGNALGPNERITIQGNVVTGFSGSGIRLRAETNNSLVKGNVVLNNGDEESLDFGDAFGNGITLEDGAYNNRVESNTVKNNLRNGIFVDETAVDNLIQSNFSLDNGEFDYRDDSFGDGTEGTANRYKKNKGRTDSPEGLIQYRIG